MADPLIDIDTGIRNLLAPVLVSGGGKIDAIHAAVFTSVEDAQELLAATEEVLPAIFLSFPSGEDLQDSSFFATAKAQAYTLTYHLLAVSGGEANPTQRQLFLAEIHNALHVNFFGEQIAAGDLPPTFEIEKMAQVGWETVSHPKLFAFSYTFEVVAKGACVATV